MFLVEDLPPLVINRPCGTRNSRRTAADAATRAADKKGLVTGVAVDFDMKIIDFLVTLNVTVGPVINWRNTASQFGHTVTDETGDSCYSRSAFFAR
jgi:plastocyanin